ncbi:MAG: hypothetical protein ABI823_16880, partial [Bryobacteraceae bacterium]
MRVLPDGTKGLSPRGQSAYSFDWIRFLDWFVSVGLSRQAKALFRSQSPEVRIVGGNIGGLEVAEVLRQVNTIAPTRMCWTMTNYGSDKGNGWHNYTTVYWSLLKDLRDKPIRIFELGLGTTNLTIPSSMPNGVPGGSLRGWRQLFPCASIFG